MQVQILRQVRQEIIPEEFGHHFQSKYVNYLCKDLLFRATWDKFPLASFIATMFGNFDNSKHISGERLTPVLLGTLYNIIGKFVLSETAV